MAVSTFHINVAAAMNLGCSCSSRPGIQAEDGGFAAGATLDAGRGNTAHVRDLGTSTALPTRYAQTCIFFFHRLLCQHGHTNTFWPDYHAYVQLWAQLNGLTVGSHLLRQGVSMSACSSCTASMGGARMEQRWTRARTHRLLTSAVARQVSATPCQPGPGASGGTPWGICGVRGVDLSHLLAGSCT